MKKLFTLLLLLIAISYSNVILAQVTESFSNIPTGSSASYQTRIWTGDDGFEWKATRARTDKTINGKAIMIKGTGHLKNNGGSIANGCGTLSFKYRRFFNGNSIMQVFVNGTQYGGDIEVSSTTPETYSEVINDSGDIDIEIKNTTSNKKIGIDDLSWTPYFTSPTLTVSPSTLTGFTYEVGSGPSASQTFDLTGYNLDGTKVTVTGTTNYEVSLDDSNFSGSVDVTYTAPTLNATPIYVRLKAGLAEGTYNGETVTCSDDGSASDKTVTCDGEVTAVPAPICYEEHFDPNGNPGGVPDGWTNNGTSSDGSSSHYGAAANCRALGSGDDIYSPSFNYPETLEFYHDASNGGNDSTATLEYRIGNDGAWTQFYSFQVTTAGKTESIDLTGITTASGATLDSKQYVHFKFLSSFNTWYLDDVVIRGNSCTIPIELMDFTAKRVDDNALIEWSTLSEKNSDYFSVEWSRDGTNFEEIAKIDAAGTSRDKREYRYIHKNPKMGVNYYRLTQYDFDGRSETFYVVSVDFDSKTLDMFIVPNRVENSLRLEFTQSVEDARLHIYNMEGQVVKSYILASGIDAFNFDVSALSSGQYIAKYVNARKTIAKRFVKL